MSLVVALPFGLAAAVAYGAAAAVQHDAVGQGEAGARSVGELLHDPRWWASIGGDLFGLVLQLVALSTGPVVLIQPLFVLCLPIALPIRAVLGGTAPVRSDYLTALVLMIALAGFFVLAGQPAAANQLSITAALLVGVLAMAAGGILTASVWTMPNAVKAVVLSAISGVWFGVESVLVNGAATLVDHDGWSALATAAGLVPAVGAVILGVSGFALSQVAFRAGNLATSFPAMLVIDPLVAVLLGAFVLGEAVRSASWAVSGYVVCVVVIAAATLRLARPARPEAVVSAGA